MSSLIDWLQENINIFSRARDLDPNVRKVIFGLLFCLLMLIILTASIIPTVSEFSVGEPSPVNVSAPADISVLDEETTEIRRELALSNVSAVFVENREALEIARDNLELEFSVLAEAAALEDGDQVESVLGEAGILLDTSQMDILRELTEEEVTGFREHVFGELERLYRGSLREGEMDRSLQDLKEFIGDIDLDENSQDLLFSRVEENLAPNMVIDEEATREREEEVLAGVQPVYQDFAQGELIVEEGELVSPVQYRALDDVGLSALEVSWLRFSGTVLYFLILTLIIIYYFKNHLTAIWRENNKLYLIETLIVILFMMAWISTLFEPDYIFYIVPVGMLSVLLTILLSTAPAVTATVYASLLLPILFDMNYNVAVVAFISGMIGIYSVAEINQRSDLIKAGFNISGVLVFTVIMLNFIQPAFTLLDIILLAGMGALNGLLVAILANGLLPYLENIFNLTSAVKLLELSNPNQPLLKRLLVEAPGTYHHSMVVGNLAETAADNIGADSLLVRVGAYYHDIGKLKRPYFFADNQFGGENPHDDINPNLSSLIIKSHVKDGVKMAKNHDLPRAVIDLIEQHQGTNLISFFYQEAARENNHSVAEESNFRYDGPKPQSKEAAILMLSDIVEAAVRSKNFDKTDPNRIENLVRGLIREKLLENQLDESELTLQELDTIAESFTKILTGIYHQRVEYPEDLEEEFQDVEGE
ncbi:HD family phosphohydrolase [Halarsenatibacter silvermanii]|uniref:HD/PDEase domain-containing protein n=1 Tax=Halarsenatibacter silvermanii TaxID=321763 RepID=A0A1G9JV34_9FIRM|nr:HDIG domain-containing metalloprotein [Halarsenatibacter silvermanii]SDL41407.1 hypothetical protein SAMN04488692_104101 [Halarsenatibacter silvermanii]